jgi:hypothetical protein
MSPKKRKPQPRRSPSKGGRPSKCTPRLTKRIATSVKKGNFFETAARAAGIDVKTFYNWLAWGSEGTEPYAKFFQALEKAAAEAEEKLVAQLRSGKQHKYMAAAIHLERRFRGKWSRDGSYELKAELMRVQLDAARADLRRKQLEADILAAKADELKKGTAQLNIHLLPDSKEFAEFARNTWGFDRARMIEAKETPDDAKPESGDGESGDD